MSGTMDELKRKAWAHIYDRISQRRAARNKGEEQCEQRTFGGRLVFNPGSQTGQLWLCYPDGSLLRYTVTEAGS